MTEAHAALEPSVAGPLSHLRILEIAEEIPGPFAGRLLHDLGAAVTKVERPGSGDCSRQAGPFRDDEPDPEASGLYTYFNRGKRSVTLDWTQPDGRDLLGRLLDETDVLIVDERFGASHDELLALCEEHAEGERALSAVSITPFGLVGPRAHWRGSPSVVSAYGGLTLYFGEHDRAPIPPPKDLALTQGGLAVAIATLLTVLGRGGQPGRGQVADISIADVLSSVHTGLAATHWVFDSRQFQRHGRRSQGGLYPNAMLRCKDGFFRIHAMSQKEWRGLLDMIGNPAWGDDPRYQDRIVNGDQYADLLDTYIESYLLQYTKNELFEQARERQLPFSPVREMHEVLEEEQLLHLGLFREITHANGEQFTAAGSPFRWRNAEDDGPPETDPTGGAPLRAPRLGEHNDEVYGTLLGLDGAELERLRGNDVI